jgi:Ku protein
MPRPIWKGTIGFGLVTVPVSLYSATERKEQLSFHLLHKKDTARVEYKRVCTVEGVDVPWSEIVKGYEYKKGRYVVMTAADFAMARTPATQSFDIKVFVDAHEVEDLYFNEPYYLAPQTRGAAKIYALLRDGLKETGKIGVGTIVLREREHLAALEPMRDALILTTMRFAHEIHSPRDLELPKVGAGWSKKEMQLTRQLIDAFAGKWDPSEFKDTYTSVLKQAIRQKIEGKRINISAPKEERPKVVNLMKALEASLKAPRKKFARAGGRRHAGSRLGQRKAS